MCVSVGLRPHETDEVFLVQYDNPNGNLFLLYYMKFMPEEVHRYVYVLTGRRSNSN